LLTDSTRRQRLEQFGESSRTILGLFPERDYERYIAGEIGNIFAPYSDESPALFERFGLVSRAGRSFPPGGQAAGALSLTAQRGKGTLA
jgi:hypothetical protein